jgi:hypothetical protein
VFDQWLGGDAARCAAQLVSEQLGRDVLEVPRAARRLRARPSQDEQQSPRQRAGWAQSCAGAPRGRPSRAAGEQPMPNEMRGVPMASIHKEITIAAPPDVVWDALRDWGAVHEHLVPGFVVDAEVDGEDRVVTFFNGAVVRELFVASDDRSRRLVWAIRDGSLGLEH